MNHYCETCGDHKPDEAMHVHEAAREPVKFCGQCGRTWWPSIDESASYPGSICDRLECFCMPCELPESQADLRPPKLSDFPRLSRRDWLCILEAFELVVTVADGGGGSFTISLPEKIATPVREDLLRIRRSIVTALGFDYAELEAFMSGRETG